MRIAGGRIGGFFGEVRRRRILRVAGVYIVVGWLIAQAAVLAETSLGLPPWLVGFIVKFVMLGLPVALVLAWTYELPLEGFRRMAPADADLPPMRAISAVDVGLVAAMFVLAAATTMQLAEPSAEPAAGAAETETSGASATDRSGEPD